MTRASAVDRITLRLLEASQIPGPYVCEPLAKGRNSRVLLISNKTNHYVAKYYFQDERDPRDRLAHEVSFLRYAESRGFANVPKLLGFDRDNSCALLKYAPGTIIRPSDVNEELVRRALEFAIDLNREKPAREALPSASEAAFSVEAHLSTVDRRIALLEAQATAAKARDFFSKELSPTWRAVRDTAVRQTRSRLSQPLADEEICVSPSDFGFHNALRNENGRLIFLDFEYAGWDDPAKLFCDFFCQIAVPVPERFMPDARSILSCLASDKPWFLERTTILLPIYRIKWACMMLNEFLPAHADRRRFAGVRDDGNAQALQIRKARRFLELASLGSETTEAHPH